MDLMWNLTVTLPIMTILKQWQDQKLPIKGQKAGGNNFKSAASYWSCAYFMNTF
jgi:hypothetical protein